MAVVQAQCRAHPRYRNRARVTMAHAVTMTVTAHALLKIRVRRRATAQHALRHTIRDADVDDDGGEHRTHPTTPTPTAPALNLREHAAHHAATQHIPAEMSA